MPATPLHRLPLALREEGAGRPVLLLHGGGGPATVAPLVSALARQAHVLAPTLPGYDGAPASERVRSIADAAVAVAGLLEARDLRDVLVVGSSLGGWLALELALGTAADRLAGLVLLDAVGVAVPGEPIADIRGLAPRALAELAWFDPDLAPDPAALGPERVAALRANAAASDALAGEPYMHDPSLLGRLSGVRVPALVVWGEGDGVVTPGYGRALADALPDARFAPLERAGHLPHLERPDEVVALVEGEAARLARG